MCPVEKKKTKKQIKKRLLFVTHKFASIQIVVRIHRAKRGGIAHCVIHLITIGLSPCSTNRINAGYQVSVCLLAVCVFFVCKIHCYDDDGDEPTVNGIFRIHSI